MKTLVILCLAVFTGCKVKANAEEDNLHLEHLKDLFWAFVAQATGTTEETAEKKPLGQEVSTRLTQNANEHAITLKNQTDILAEEWMNNFAKEAEVLKEHLESDLMTLRDQLESYTDNIKSQIQQRVEELRAAIAPYAESLNSETLKATLLQKSDELRGSMEQSVKELQAQLEPFTADIKEKVDQHLQEIKQSEDLQANN